MAGRGPDNYTSGIETLVPGQGAFAIVKSDVTVFQFPTRLIYVGTTGDVAVTMVDGSTVVFVACPAGMLLPIVATQVLSTGTSASNLVGIY